MAYEPTTWKSGDVVTSAKLNKLENGVKDAGAFVITVTSDESGEIPVFQLNKTYNEIKSAFITGRNCIIQDSATCALVINVQDKGGAASSNEVVSVSVNPQTFGLQADRFIASNPDDYPVLD